MGRDTLDDAISSVLAQTLPANEIIVVAGGKPIISLANLKRVRVVENYQADSKVWTAAHNRNVGVKHSESDFVAFLDDDDSWHEKKMETQMHFLVTNPDHVSLSSANYRVRKWMSYKRPLKVLKPNQGVLIAHYGKRRFLPTPYYTPTPGIVVPSEIVKRISFDESLPGFEDTWWLHQIQVSGFRIFQHKEALVTVNANPVRSISRDTLAKNLAWAKKLAEVDRKLANNYLKGICLRNAIIGRRWHDLKIYLRSVDLRQSEK
jgi:glycosyltransferase involved in cell wall biosynthesis